MFLAWRSLGALAAIVLDRWWLQSVTDAPLWPTVVSAKVELTVTAVAVTGLLLGGSLALVHRRGRVSDHDVGGLVRRYRQRMGPAHRWALVGAVAVLTWRIGAAASTHWQEWLLFLHGGSVGRDVPELGGDLGDYLFRLPFLAVVSVWLRQLLIVALRPDTVRLVGRWGAPLAMEPRWSAPHTADRARPPRRTRRPARRRPSTGRCVRAPSGAGGQHVGVVRRAGLLGALRRCTGDLDRCAGRDRLRLRAGAGRTVTALAPRTRRGDHDDRRPRRWVRCRPRAGRSLPRRPAEAAHQLPYFEHNLAGTREAYLLDSVVETERLLDDGIDAVDPTSAEAVARAPIWDVTQLAPALQVLQGRAATRITDLDLDRYELEATGPAGDGGGTVSEPQRPA